MHMNSLSKKEQISNLHSPQPANRLPVGFRATNRVRVQSRASGASRERSGDEGVPLASLADSRSDSHLFRCRIHASLGDFFSALAGSLVGSYIPAPDDENNLFIFKFGDSLFETETRPPTERRILLNAQTVSRSQSRRQNVAGRIKTETEEQPE